MPLRYFALLSVFFLLLFACEEESPKQEFYVPESPFELELARGGISGSLNPFPLIDSAIYLDFEDYPGLRDDDLVLMLKAGGQVYVYPHNEMYVEIVNEDFGYGPIAITFCPLTRSGIGWSRLIESDTLLFTASGYLLYDNILALDTLSGSLFAQIFSLGFDGEHISKHLTNVPLIQTKWETVRDYFSDAKIFDAESSLALIDHNSSIAGPEQSYRKPDDKQQFGLFDIKGVQIFNYEDFPGDLHALYVSGRGAYTLVGSSEKELITGYKANFPLNLIEGSFPVVLEDEGGSQYDIFGEAVSGPNKGAFLEPVNGFVAYAWAWNKFFPEEIN